MLLVLVKFIASCTSLSHALFTCMSITFYVTLGLRSLITLFKLYKQGDKAHQIFPLLF